MAFSNLEVALTDLPTIEEVTYQDLDPLYARMICGVTIVVQGIVLLAALAAFALLDATTQSNRLLVYGGAGGAMLFILFVIYRFKAARAVSFAIRERDLMLRSGLFWRREVIQPSRRVQHVELIRGPLEKRLGLARLKLFSAGTGKATFTIPGLRLMTAARIRRFVLQAART